MNQSDAIRLAIFAVALSLTGCANFGALSPLAPLERKLIYHPTPMDDSIQLPPSSGIEDVYFRSGDETSLHGWFLPHPQPRAVALVLHGNAGNIAHRIDSLKILSDRHQLSVFLFDYRGYGRSQGTPSEAGILMDARAARRWLARRTGISESDVVLFGRSLGGGVAVDLAAKDGARGLVLASTFTSLPEVGRHHFPYLPTSALMTQRLDSLSSIAEFHGPLLQSHGDADRVIPFEMGQALFAAANHPKQFVVLQNGGHNDPHSESYRKALDEFIDRLPACKAGEGG